MALFVGVDVGTSGIKTIAVDETGKVVATASREHPLLTPRPAWAEQDPQEWWRGTCETLRRVASQVGPSSIAAVSFSGQMHGAVFLDATGNVIRPCILWCDQRTDRECEQILERFGQERLNELVSNAPLAGFTAPKVLWLRNNEPENYARVAALLLPKDYVRYRLTGELAAEVSDAAGTLMFDVRRRRWSEEFLAELDIPLRILPPVHESIDRVGAVTEEAAEETGLAPGTPVVAGGADNTCGAVGVGAVRPGIVLASTGTSGVIFCPTEAPTLDPEQRIHSFCHSVPGTWYLMGCMLSAGGSLRWFRDNFCQEEVRKAASRGVDPYDVMTEEAAGVPPGAHGLLFLPYLMGERSPHKDPYARGVFFGATAMHTRAHFIRAILEGVAFGMKDSLEIMRELGQPLEEVRATGGGARSALWRQIQADVFGVPLVTVSSSEEGPAFGAALIAAVGVGAFTSIEEACRATITATGQTKPTREGKKLYRALYREFRRLYPAVRRRFRSLAQLLEKTA